MEDHINYGDIETKYQTTNRILLRPELRILCEFLVGG